MKTILKSSLIALTACAVAAASAYADEIMYIVKGNQVIASYPVKDVDYITFDENELPTPDFTLSTTGTGTWYVDANILPTDKNMLYWMGTIPRAEYDQFADDSELLAKDKEVWDLYFLTKEELSAALQQGDREDTKIANLTADTDYYLYAYGVDAATRTMTTPVTKIPFRTTSVVKNDFTADIDINVRGTIVDVKITPSDDKTAYMYAVIDKRSSYYGDGSESHETIVRNFIAGFQQFLSSSPYQFFNLQNNYGYKESKYDDLDPDNGYVLFAVAWDEGLNLLSEVTWVEFSTTSATVSDNQITVNPYAVGSDTVIYSVTTTNDDPYILYWGNAADFQGLSDTEIFDLLQSRHNRPIIDDLSQFMRNGDYENIKDHSFQPETEYCMLAFGYSGGQMTTPVSKKFFKTKAVGEVTAADLQFFFVTMPFDEYQAAIVAVGNQELTVEYYTDVFPSSYTDEQIRQAIAAKAEAAGQTVQEYLISKAKKGIKNMEYYVSEGDIELGVEYQGVAIGITTAGEYAQDTFSRSQPFTVNATASGKVQKMPPMQPLLK